MSIRHNQEFKEDPEIGALLRTADFRRAVPLAWDREMVNQVAFAGLGTAQNQTPEPGTPYYPGADVARLDVARDPTTVRRLMSELDYSDGDGYLDSESRHGRAHDVVHRGRRSFRGA